MQFLRNEFVIGTWRLKWNFGITILFVHSIIRCRNIVVSPANLAYEWDWSRYLVFIWLLHLIDFLGMIQSLLNFLYLLLNRFFFLFQLCMILLNFKILCFLPLFSSSWSDTTSWKYFIEIFLWWVIWLFFLVVFNRLNNNFLRICIFVLFFIYQSQKMNRRF